MVSISMIVLASSIVILYDAGFEEERQRLIESAQSQAQLMGAVARFDKKHLKVDAFESTLSQIREAHEKFKGFGKSGEFTLAKLEDNQIVFLLSHRHHDLMEPRPVAFDGVEAEPMRLALQGKSGSLVGLDYRGETVLAAYEPVTELNLGVVAKIDLSEVRKPFLQAAGLTIGIAFFVILIGAWAFHRITKPIQAEIEDKNERLEIAVHGTNDGLWLWDIRTNHEWHAPQWGRLLGYDEDTPLPELYDSWESNIHPDDKQRVLDMLNQHLSDGTPYDCEQRLRTKDGEYKWFRDRGIALRDEAGNPIRMGGSIQDITELKNAQATIKTISGLVPLCAWCSNRVKEDDGNWISLTEYFGNHTDAEVTHGMCPQCAANVHDEVNGLLSKKK